MIRSPRNFCWAYALPRWAGAGVARLVESDDSFVFATLNFHCKIFLAAASMG